MNNESDFLELLIEKKILSRQSAKELSEKFWGENYTILLHLLDIKAAPKNKLARAWGDSLGVAYMELKKALFQQEAMQKLPEDFARSNEVIPVYQLNNVITIAASNPKDKKMLGKIEQITKSQLSVVFSFPEEISEAIDKYYVKEESKGRAVNQIPTAPKRLDINDLPSVIPEKTKQYLVNNTKEIYNQVSGGKTPDIETCNDVTDTIIEEVHQQLDGSIIQCINQLRIIDEYTYSHSINTAILTSAFAKTLGYSQTVIKELALGALLHDIGKIKIPKEVLYKQGKLNAEETKIIKNHSYFSYQIMKQMGLTEKILEIAHSHHERMDGKGFPRGLNRENISLYTQLVSIVNVYDTLVSERPNKSRISHHEALNLMLLEGNNAFNFEFLYKFVNLVYKEDINSLKKEAYSSILYGVDSF